MSGCACSCSFDYYDVIGACVMRNRVARSIPKSGATCPICETDVEIGERCIDYAGLRDGSGWFDRFHEDCFLLMEQYAEQFCHGEWCYPFDLDEASHDVVDVGHLPWAREWLERYERVWPRLEDQR